MLTDAQRRQFDDTGLVRLPGAISTTDAAQMCARLWQFLDSEHGIMKDRPETWPTGTVRRLKAATRSGSFNPMASAAVREALDDLLGADSRLPGTASWWGTPLVTFRSTDSWTVPTASWHLDGTSESELPGITVFAYLAPVETQGGGTLVLEGSHRLINRYLQEMGTGTSATTKAGLAKLDPWLRDLWTGQQNPHRTAKYLSDGADVWGQPLVVRELTGEPGDVVLMHSRSLHAPAPNALTQPRMMAVEHVDRAWRPPK